MFDLGGRISDLMRCNIVLGSLTYSFSFFVRKAEGKES